LLVGKTSGNTIGTAGIEIDGNNNRIMATRDGNEPLLINRLTSDGTLVDLKKDGTTVGSIGSFAGVRPYFSSPNTGISPYNQAIYPVDGSGDATNGATDIGHLSYRFKDLYLSGNVTLGSTSQINASSALYLDTDIHVFRANNETEKARIDASGRLLLGHSASVANYGINAKTQVQGTGADTSSLSIVRNSNNENPAYLVIGKTRSTTTGGSGLVQNNDTIGDISFIAGDGVDNVSRVASIKAQVDGGASANDTPGRLVFSTTADGAQEATERMRIDRDGNLLVGTTDTTLYSNTAGDGVNIRGIGEIQIANTNDVPLWLNRMGSDGAIANFRKAGSAVGSISVTSSATAYNTSSDQRLKDNIVDAPSASDDIDAIQVRSFDWKADGSHQKYGMVAQELQSVAPEAVSGDADSDDMMGIDYSKLVPMMLKEIQSLRARVAQLEGEN